MLRFAIRRGLYPAGALPLEHDLIGRLRTSRNAVRAALRRLAAEGVLHRRPGFGTYVVSEPWAYHLDLLRTYKEQEPRGIRSAYEVLDAAVVPAPEPVADALGVHPGEPAVVVDRLACIDGCRVSVITYWHGADRLAGLLGADLTGDYFAAVEAQLGVPLHDASIVIDAIEADGATATLLGVRVGAPLLFIESVLRDEAGEPVGVGFTRTRPDRAVVAMVSRRPGAVPSA